MVDSHIYIYIYLLQICLVCLSVCVSLTKGLWTKKLTWVISIYVKIFLKKSLSVRKIFSSGKVTFFSKLDFFNWRLRLNETTKGKTKYMSILVIIRRDSMLYLRIIGPKIKPPSLFFWTAFLNVTIVTWLYISPMKKPRDVKFCVKLD